MQGGDAYENYDMQPLLYHFFCISCLNIKDLITRFILFFE